jgi:hypothetical protein
LEDEDELPPLPLDDGGGGGDWRLGRDTDGDNRDAAGDDRIPQPAGDGNDTPGELIDNPTKQAQETKIKTGLGFELVGSCG